MSLDLLPDLPFLTSSAALEACPRRTSRAKKGVIYAAVIFNPNSCGESDRATQQVQRNRLIVFSRQEFDLDDFRLRAFTCRCFMLIQINHQKENRLVIQYDTRKRSRASCDSESELFVARIENNQIADCRVVIRAVLVYLAEALDDVCGRFAPIRIKNLGIGNEPFRAF